MWATMTIIIVAITVYLVLGVLFLHSAADPGGTFPRLLQWTFWPVAVPLGRRGSGQHAAPANAIPVAAALAAEGPSQPGPAAGGASAVPPVPTVPADPMQPESAGEQDVEDQGDLPVEDPPDPDPYVAWENFVRRLSS